MNLLVINKLHHKNLIALKNYKNLNIKFINYIREIDDQDLNKIDCIYSPSEYFDYNKYKDYKIKFIFGPHFSVFPNINVINKLISDNTVYVQPSDWVCHLWKSFSFCDKLNIRTLPFGVDTNKFINDNKIEKDHIIIYYKSRHPNELKQIIDFIKNCEKNIKIFSYNNKYKEEEYLKYLKKAKYGIWLGRHESQGFALQEALSCNVPLLVWDVKTMKQEYGYCYNNDNYATSIPYWDSNCGEFFYDYNEIEKTYNIFISKINDYTPRKYILDNLTFEKCEDKLLNLIKNI